MTERGENLLDDFAKRLRETENNVEDLWSDFFLEENLFHKHYEKSAHERNGDANLLLGLKVQFLEEKQRRKRNMGEVFELALDDRYLGKVHLVQLGKSENPSNDGEIDNLKTEYNQFLKWMKENGIVEEELSRQECKRDISYRLPSLQEAYDKYWVMVRNRTLIDVTHDHNGQKVHLEIAKRMIFAMPIGVIAFINQCYDGFDNEEAKNAVEKHLDAKSPSVIPIRTSYYLETGIGLKD